MNSHSFSAHFITSFVYLKRLLPLFILPVAGNIYRYVMQGYRFSSSVFDVAVALIALMWGLKESRSISVKVSGGKLFVKKGFVFKSQWQVDIEKIAAIYVDQNVLTYLVSAARVRVETIAGARRKKAELDLYISKGELPRLVQSITKFEGERSQKCSVGQSLLLALSETSAKSGLLIFSTSVNYLGKFLGRRFDPLMLKELANEKNWDTLLPPLLTAVATVITAGILLSFVVSVIRHFSLSIENSEALVHLRQGVLRKSDMYIFKSNISAVIEVSSPILTLFRRKNVCLNLVGWGNKQGAVTLLPAIKSNGFSVMGPNSVKSHRQGIIRGARIPALLTLVLLALWGGLTLILPQMQGLWAILFLSAAVISGYRMFVKLRAIKRGGAFKTETVGTVFAKRMTFYQCSAKAERVECITLRQSPFDRNWGMCKLIFDIHDKRKSRFLAAYLDESEAERFTSCL